MHHPINTIISPFPMNLPVIDSEFDQFDLNYDLEMDLRENEAAHFYHDALDLKE